jgi:hypothetical protein
MSKKIKFLSLSALECSIHGFCFVTKKRNQFFVGNDLNSWQNCPEYLIEQFSKEWEETHGKKA